MRETGAEIATGWLAVSGLLLAVGALVFGNMVVAHVSNVWRTDGLTQHFPALVHFNEIARAFLRDPGRGFEMWSFNLGLGADNLGSLSYYMTDPFAFLSLATPMRSLEYAYEWLFFLRLFAAGLAAYGYLRGGMRSTRFPAMLGSLMYVFTMFALIAGARHPYFANAMVFFPLVLLGIEQTLARRRPYVLIAAVFLAAISNFYFFFQISIVSVVYALIRFGDVTPRGKRVQRFALSGTTVGGAFALGLGLSAFILGPVLAAFFASSRAGSHQMAPLFYDVPTYRTFIAAFTSSLLGAHEMYAGFSILGVVVLPALYMRRGNKTLKAMLVLFPLMMVFPAFGTLFNGLAFPSYRFIFMWPLFLGAAVAVLLSEGRPFSLAELMAMLAGLLGYSVAVVWAQGGATTEVVLPLCLGGLMWLAFAFESLGMFLHHHEAREAAEKPAEDPSGDSLTARRRRPYSMALRLLVGVLTIAGIGYVAMSAYDRASGNRLADFVPFGQVRAAFDNDAGAQAARLTGDGFFRVEKQDNTYGSSLWVTSSNDAIVQGFNGTAFYFSVMSGDVFGYLRGLDDRSMRASYDFTGFDDRAALEAIGAVRYYIAREKGAQYVPYGFAPYIADGHTTVYENRLALPLGFVYHSAVDSSAYAQMTPLERQEAMLEGIVIDDAAAPTVRRITPDAGIIDVPFSVSAMPDAIWDSAVNTIETQVPNTGLDLTFAPVPDAELYIQMKDVEYGMLHARPAQLTSDTPPGPAVIDPRTPPNMQALRNLTPLHLSFGTSGPFKIERVEGPSYVYYWGDNSTLANLGYFAAGTDHARIRVVEPALVKASEIHVYAVPMARFAEQIGRLAAQPMTDIRTGVNVVAGSVESHGDGVLFLSVPYSPGWSATVDDRPTDVLRANGGFIGVPVADGRHRVELHYLTPGLKAGLSTTFASLLVLAGLVSGTEAWRYRRVLRQRRAREAASGETA